jgi:alcohol dehydrogenase
MSGLQQKASSLISAWKKSAYTFGTGCLSSLPGIIKKSQFSKIHLVTGSTAKKSGQVDILLRRLAEEEIHIVGTSAGARENSPVEDVLRVRDDILQSSPDAVVSFGGGSLIDGVKASIVLAGCKGRLDDYYGVGRVNAKISDSGCRLLPHLAVMTASASAAHLTKYANVTDMTALQKKLIIDPAIVPTAALFDYGLTTSMSARFTAIGAWDGIGHLSEAYFGFSEKDPRFQVLEEAVLCGLELILSALPKALAHLDDPGARTSLGLATDLGGLAIMTGGTNGPHLNSFSLVDVAEHGCAVAVLQAYYGCFFSSAIPGKIRTLAKLYQKSRYIGENEDLGNISGRELGLVYGRALQRFARATGMPLSLGELEGFTPAHVEKMLFAARDPALSSKLEAMPVPMKAEDVERFMRPILNAAASGNLEGVPERV